MREWPLNKAASGVVSYDATTQRFALPLEQALEGRRQVLESRGGVGLDPVVVRIVGRCGVFRGQSLARQFTNAMVRPKLLNLIWRSGDDPSSGS